MSDYDFPELPSDEELGITDEDREQYEKDFPDDGPEMSDAEMAALLGEAPPAKKPAPGPKQPAPDPAKPASGPSKAAPSAPETASGGQAATADQTDARKKAAKAVRQAEKKQSKEEKQAARERRKAEKAARKEAARQAKAQAREAKSAARAAAAEERRKAAEADAAIPAWRGPVTLVILLLFGFFASSRTGIPGPVPANAPDTAFSSARAMATLVELAREAHPPGSPEHARVRELIVDRLASLGIESEVQTTTSVYPAPEVRDEEGNPVQMREVARTATVRNVVARIPGTDPSGTVLVTAHYDSREIAVGAADDGSGVVTILEALRAIGAGEPLRNDLVVLITDAEELGMLGARAFVDQHRWMADVDLVLSFEMRGGGGPSIMFETNVENGWVVEALAEFAPVPFAYSLAFEVYQRMPNDTDFTPFREAGVQGLNFAGIDNAHVYHQPMDTPDNLSERTLQHHGLHAVGALRWFGEADLGSVNAPNRSYFSVPGLGLVHYPQPLVHALSALLVVLVLVLAGVALRGGARPLGMVAGFLLFLVVAAGGYVVGSTVLDRVVMGGGEVGALHGSLLHSEGWYVLAVALAVLTLTTGTTGVARRWLRRDELLLGALLVPTLGAVAVGIVAPLAAAHLQVPALACVLAGLVGAVLGTRAAGAVGWVVAVILALPVLLLLQPVVELVWLALTFRLIGMLAVLMALAAFMILPALDALRAPNVWWAPLTLGVAAALSLGLGLLLGGPSAERPLPSTLAYAYEHGSGEALWVTAPAAEGDAFDARAMTWAEERTGGAFEETRDLTGFGYPAGVVPVRRAEVVSAPPPVVDVLVDSIVGSERRVRLGVRSAIGAEMLGFELAGGTRLRAINDVSLPDPDALRFADHWGEPEESVTLDLTMPADEAIGVHVVEHLLRPEELLGAEAFQRPDDLAPNVNRLSDRAMLRYSVAAFVDPRHAFLRPTGRPDTGVPVDSLSVGTPPPGVPADSGGVMDSATAVTDTLATDTLALDTLVADTLAPDTLAADTLVADTTTVDTLRVDTTVVDTIPLPDTTGTARR